ncbi:cytokinin riboside 5'-monophosphate phosphoribohydrolase [Planctomycetota bacterium]|nr:cytokinin riboside 5'-monophosphate phosphoribohydrolase [Planctomycetota bacterium]
MSSKNKQATRLPATPPRTAGHDERILELERSTAYRQAHLDPDFMGRVELRPVRLQLEMLKPELVMQDQRIESTVVVFGGTRVIEASHAQQKLNEAQDRLAASPGDLGLQRRVRIAENLLKKAPYYDEARKLGRIVSEHSQHQEDTEAYEFVICTGGGPGIMEAANRGAHDIGAMSIGLNVTLPFEHEPNSFITPELCFEFKYFALRKMHFLMRAKAMVAFPGGFGTLDELFETLTLIQTQRMQPIPVILFGRDYWQRLVNWEMLVEEGTVSAENLDLISYAETADECWQLIRDFYRAKPATDRLPRCT